MTYKPKSKLPPYSRPLKALQASGKRPINSINLFIGNYAWQKGNSFSRSYPERTMILPPWICPTEYSWPVTQCDVLIHDTGFAEEDYLQDIVLCLLRDGASLVRALSPEFLLTVYHRE